MARGKNLKIPDLYGLEPSPSRRGGSKKKFDFQMETDLAFNE